MYLREVNIKGIRSITDFTLILDPQEYAGWHVIIGDNGSGKTTLVRSIALALVGPDEAKGLRQNWSEWLRKESKSGEVSIQLDFDPKFDKTTGKGKPASKYYVPIEVNLTRIKSANISLVEPQFGTGTPDPRRYVWGKGKGWFSASYGPFRRFSGGNKDYDKLYYSYPKLAAHLSAFGEDVALTEALTWLQNLQFKKLEKQPEGQILDNIELLINQGGLLPHGTVFDQVTSEGVLFRDGNGFDVPVEQLSDGYRSMLSMTFEIVRQMIRAYGEDLVFREIAKGKIRINLPGVVIIDEIDAHLHPSWQRNVGQWFCRLFPKIQFIVTTHSPLICQSAEKGSVWRLPTPGSGKMGGRITGLDFDRLIYGNVLEALDTELFGSGVTRSDSSRLKLQRLAELNVKSILKKLSKAEREELTKLRSILPTDVNKGLGE